MFKKFFLHFLLQILDILTLLIYTFLELVLYSFYQKLSLLHLLLKNNFPILKIKLLQVLILSLLQPSFLQE